MCPTLFDFYPDPDDCTKFYRCFWGAAYPFHCPTGTKWNHKLLTCDFDYNVDCGGTSDLQDHSQTNQERPLSLENDYESEGDHEYGKEAHPWEKESYELYDEDYGLHIDNKGVEGDARKNTPIHGITPGLADPRVETSTPQTPPSTASPPTTHMSLIDFLYPDGSPGPDVPREVADKERSDVTHDYAWYEGRDYNPDYAYDNSRVIQDYGDYVYDYWRHIQDYSDDNTGTGHIGTTVSNNPEDYSYEVSYFQNGYPGYRHHYEPTDFLSPAYARHNGPIGKRK